MSASRRFGLAASGAWARWCSNRSEIRDPDAQQLEQAALEGLRQLGLAALPGRRTSGNGRRASA